MGTRPSIAIGWQGEKEKSISNAAGIEQLVNQFAKGDL
jgi:hypothetical protein